MLKISTALLGFAFFGAVFAGIVYQPDEVERQIGKPKYRLGPGALDADFIEPAAFGENVTVNITVLSGGPIHVYLMDMENLTLYALNATENALQITGDVSYDKRYTRFNVSFVYDFSFVADGENRTVVVLQSAMPYNESLPLDEQATEVSVQMRYVDRETKSLILGYILAAPSFLLVTYVFWRHLKRARSPAVEGADPARPHDDEL